MAYNGKVYGENGLGVVNNPVKGVAYQIQCSSFPGYYYDCSLPANFVRSKVWIWIKRGTSEYLVSNSPEAGWGVVSLGWLPASR